MHQTPPLEFCWSTAESSCGASNKLRIRWLLPGGTGYGRRFRKVVSRVMLKQLWLGLDTYASFKANRQLVEDAGPIRDRNRPFSGNVPGGQVEQPSDGLWSWEGP